MTDQTKPPPQLGGAYLGLPDHECSRLNVTVSTEDRTLFTTVCPLPGTTNAILSAFYKHICNELRRKGINSYDPDALLTILHECTDNRPDRDTSTPPNSGGTTGLRSTYQGNANESADAERSTSQRERDTGASGASEAKKQGKGKSRP